MKYSVQRQAILENVCGRCDHPTAEMVYDAVKKIIPNISLGTVYRNLNQLAENGVIHKISMSNDKDRFDGVLEEHVHMHCEKCGDLFDISNEILKEINSVLANETGYHILSHNIVFYGICHDCQEI